MCPDCGAPILPIPVPPGGKIYFGGYDWYVLERQSGRTLVITEKIISSRPYHHAEGKIAWETCDLRGYLNGEFYSSFDSADRKRIVEVSNENPDNPWYGTRGGNPTRDKIFLLGIAEIIKYFGDSGQIKTRYMYPSPYGDWCKDEFLPWIDDRFNINRRAVDEEGVCAHYWLRSPGSNERVTTNIMGFCGDGFDQGCINIMGCLDMVDGHFLLESSGTDSLTNPGGVRPAMWLVEEQ
jgi:hypothetical protein